MPPPSDSSPHSPPSHKTTDPRIFRRLLGLLRPWRGAIVLSVILLIAGGICELFPAFVWKYVADDVATNRPSSPMVAFMASFNGRVHNPYLLILSAVTWLLVIYVIGELLGTIETNLLNRVAQKFILKIRNQVYHKLQTQSLSYLQRQRTGDLISRAMSDIEELQTFIVNGIDTILGEGVIWIVTVCVVMHYDWRVASLSLAPLITVYFLLRIFNKKIKPIYAAARDRLGDVSNRLQENLSGILVIKIFGREKEEAERFADATRAHYDQQIKSINARSLYFPFARTVGFFSNIFMIGVGGYFYLAGKGFTIGDLIAFRAYWWRLYGPVQTLARVNDMVQRATAAGRRVFEILDAPDELPDAPGAARLEQVRGALQLENVTFGYPADAPGAVAPTVLDQVNIHIEPGQTVALCGPSGAGKSTVLNLLLRFYDPVSGRVLLDGRDLKSIPRADLRKRFALVQQETFLFNDSILDNIRYGHAEATMEQVIAAAKAANAHGFISKLPNGYDTKVGERGIRLSGGQKQRISIARAFLADPSVLLLDEPTSSVEPDSEAAIIAALDRLMAGRTTVLTSHRPSLINQADVVYVIADGRITEQGRPAELAEGDGWFSRFMRSAEEAMPAVEMEGQPASSDVRR
jgi:ABC-type multidrug transport system fused ATPase/permease subunit